MSVILPWHLISGWNFVKQRGVLQGEETGWVTGSSLALLSVAGCITLANSPIPRAFQHLELLLQRGPASRLSVLSSLTDAQKHCWPLVEASLYTCIRYPPPQCCVNLSYLTSLSLCSFVLKMRGVPISLDCFATSWKQLVPGLSEAP